MVDSSAELQLTPECTSESAASPEKFDEMGKGKEIFIQQSRDSRRPNLFLQIPARSLEKSNPNFMRVDNYLVISPGSTRTGLPHRPSSVKCKSSMKNLLPQRSFKMKNLNQDGEKTVLITPDTPPSNGPSKKPSASRPFSLNKGFLSSSVKATHSLPVTPSRNYYVEPLGQRNLHGHSDSCKLEAKQNMTRSLSVPVNVKNRSIRRMDSTGGLIRAITVTPRPVTVDGTSPNEVSITETVSEDAGEDISEEEAVCRICFIELGEGGDSLKLECSCKGELALAHQECALKWFGMRGNSTCDVCKQDVKNLPVTLLKIQKPQIVVREPLIFPQQREVAHYRIWQDVLVLLMVSMLAYFCFLEQLLVSDMGARALAISLPFSCALGLLSSMIATTMVSKSYIWAYASFQFASVILFAHIFYFVLNVNPVLAVLLSSFTGFGIATSTCFLLAKFLQWRGSGHTGPSHQHLRPLQQLQQYHQNVHYYDQQHHQQEQELTLSENPNGEHNFIQQESAADNRW